jgi:hypothetical protein
MPNVPLKLEVLSVAGSPKLATTALARRALSLANVRYVNVTGAALPADEVEQLTAMHPAVTFVHGLGVELAQRPDLAVMFGIQ